MEEKNLEVMKTEAFAFLDAQVEAQNLIRKTFDNLDVAPLNTRDTIQIRGIVLLSELTGIYCIREDWDGNKVCDSNWDILHFNYKGYEFFELVDKEENCMKGSKPRILAYMRQHRGITSQDAFKYLGITRLSARIKELRDMGYDIRTLRMEGQNRYGEITHYGLYVLKE